LLLSIAAAAAAAAGRRHDGLWRAQALKTLPALMAACDMLICGEDLGFVPACLPPVMHVSALVCCKVLHRCCTAIVLLFLCIGASM
jgi:4-alpha-glucanotransferase